MKTLNVQECLYEQVESMVTPIIESNAKKFHRQLNMTLDEARQEARFGLMLALREYDYNASRGGVFNFASTAVLRHFLKVWAAYRTQQRHPHMVVVDDSGNRKAVPVAFAEPDPSCEGDFLDALPGLLEATDGPLMLREGEGTAQRLRTALEGQLSPRDRAVLECKIDPPRGLRMLMCAECTPEPTIQLIGRHLGLSKNAVDWALRRIRETTLTLIAGEFSELSSLAVVQGYAERH